MNMLAVDLVVKASLVLVVAALTDIALRRRASAATRHFVWTMAVTALLALPVALGALPRWVVNIPVSSATDAHPPDVAVGAPLVSAAAASTALADASPAAPAPAPLTPQRRFDPLAFAFALYSAGLALLLWRLAAEQLTLRKFTRRADVIEDADWTALADTCSRELRIHRPIRLLRADDEVMPFTFGTLQPTIVLPAASARWSRDRRTAVLLHELAHVARADCLAQRCAAIACALYWPHPGVWWAARRLRVEREFACDDLVLSAGTAAREYAHHLLEIAHAFRGTPAPATALGMARARQLEHRLLAVIDDARNRRPMPVRARFAAGLTAAALLLPIAAAQASVVRDDSSRGIMPLGRALNAVPAAQDRDKSRDRFTAADFSGTWDLRPSREPGMVHVSLRTTHSQNGTTLPLSRFAGINESGMTAAVRDGRIVDGTVHFANRRDAGTFTFEGVCRNQMCGGTYTFAPDSTFPSRLAKYGVGAPTASEQYELAMEDVGVEYLEGLKREGYAVPDVHTLVRAAEHGVSLEYVKSMSALGYKLGTLDPLIRMRDHGVDPAYVKEMAAQGFTKLDAAEVVRLRDHGVDPEYLKEMRSLNLGTIAPADFVTARDHGVDAEFARGIAALGYKNLPLDTLIRIRDHGVDPEYIHGLTDLGYKDVPMESLVRMRDHGVDPEYVRGLAALGYKDVPIESLIRMRDHGVDPSFIRRLQERGAGHLSIDDLIRRRDRGDDGR